MADTSSITHSTKTSFPGTYLEGDESIVIVDDSKEILLIFGTLLRREGFSVFTAATSAEFYQLLSQKNIALVLLDIDLPDNRGTDILKDISPRHPALSIIMLTGTTDLEVALHCMRQGADDYLTKPVSHDEFKLSVTRVLQKRRLVINNRKYQQQLELSNYRAQFLHQLNLKMNTAYLNSIELNTVLQSILVGITAEEGLQFNRAFLLLFNEEHSELQGKMAIGPPSKAGANQVWGEIKSKNLNLTEILKIVKNSSMQNDSGIQSIVQKLRFPATDSGNVLIKACTERTSIYVEAGQHEGHRISEQLQENLQGNTFIVTPLFPPNKSLGVIIADNFVTSHPITKDDINSLEIFASQASLAIEHSRLDIVMQNKINELEAVTQELEKSKDLLIDAERYSALGLMSAQLAHAIRNPITTIGGIARLLVKNSAEEKTRKFLDMIIRESSRIEATLDTLFNFVGEDKPDKSCQPLYPLILKSIRLFYSAMKKQSIRYKLNLPEPDPEPFIDIRFIRQMLLHLIRNGIEAMPNGGDLVITCTKGDAEIRITIEDSGPGMGASDIDRASDPFFTTKTYGTGMGLTLVEKIVADHQGYFSLKHSQRGGLIATAVLPTTP